jgi:hypothetical protein
VSKNVIKQLNTLPVLHFNLCLPTEYNETTAHFNGNFDTDNRSLSAQQLSERTVFYLNLRTIQENIVAMCSVSCEPFENDTS